MYVAGLPLLLIKINRALTPYNFLLFATFHDLKVTLAKGHSLCEQCLYNLLFMKKGSSSPNLSKLARADISCQFMQSLCRTVYTMNGL